jgi:probable HAF family extracellular repeat protein
MNTTLYGRRTQGGRLIKTSRGIMSIAPALGAAAFGVICAGSVSAQDAWPAVPNETMTELGAFEAYALSADGSVIVGRLYEAGDGPWRRVFVVSWEDGSTTPTKLGTLEGLETSHASAVSADGSVIVGKVYETGGDSRNSIAAAWVDGSTAPIGLGRLGGIGSTAHAVSADGSVIVGEARIDVDQTHAVSWVNGSTEATDLGTLGGTHGYASAVSADGSVIVGYAYDDNNGFDSKAAAWVGGSTVAINLGTLGGDNSRALAVSADGSVIIGHAQQANYESHAVKWVDGHTTATDLGTLGGNYSKAHAVSADGSVIVGYATNADGNDHAASWVGGSTTAIDLGTLGGNRSTANAVSADGSVIVGQAENADGDTRAVSWVDGSTEATDLGTLGGTYGHASAVSADGSVIVGSYQGNTGGAFIYKTQMQDLSNLALSFPAMANDTQIAVAELGYSAGRLMGTTCFAEVGSACLRVGGTLSNTDATSSDNIEARSNQSLSLTYGRGLNAQTTLGGTLSITPSGSDNNGFDMGRTVGLSLWGAYSESGQLGTGWQASASVGRNTGNADISRGRGLDNVVVSTGSADVTTNSMQATLGYGVQQQDWLFTPSATLTRHTTTRDAYSESGGDFNAAYDSLSVSSTTLDLQLAADYHVSDTGTLMLEAGMVKDLNVDAITLTGTSDMPGMAAVSTDGGLERNDTRGFASIGYRHELNDSSSITGALRAGQSIFGNQLQVNVGVGFAMEF